MAANGALTLALIGLLTTVPLVQAAEEDPADRLGDYNPPECDGLATLQCCDPSGGAGGPECPEDEECLLASPAWQAIDQLLGGNGDSCYERPLPTRDSDDEDNIDGKDDCGTTADSQCADCTEWEDQAKTDCKTYQECTLWVVADLNTPFFVVLDPCVPRV
jgi:hypothetical protein